MFGLVYCVQFGSNTSSMITFIFGITNTTPSGNLRQRGITITTPSGNLRQRGITITTPLVNLRQSLSIYIDMSKNPRYWRTLTCHDIYRYSLLSCMVLCIPIRYVHFFTLQYSVRSCMVLFTHALSCLVLYGIAWFFLLLYGPIRICIVLYSSVRSYMVLFSPVWSRMDPVESCII